MLSRQGNTKVQISLHSSADMRLCLTHMQNSIFSSYAAHLFEHIKTALVKPILVKIQWFHENIYFFFIKCPNHYRIQLKLKDNYLLSL